MTLVRRWRENASLVKQVRTSLGSGAPRSAPPVERTVVQSPPWEAVENELTRVPSPGEGKAPRGRFVDRTASGSFSLEVEAEIVTADGRAVVLRTSEVSVGGFVVPVSPKGKALFLPGMRADVRLRDGPMTVDFQAEVERISSEGEPGMVAFRIVFLASEQEAELVRLIGMPNAPAPSRSKRRFASTLLIGAIAAALSVAGAGAWVLSRSRHAVAVPAATVSRGDVTSVARSAWSGEAVPRRRETVRSPLQKTAVLKLEVSRGDQVASGAVLARADDPHLREEGAAAQARVAAAEARQRRAREAMNAPAANPYGARTEIDAAFLALTEARASLASWTAASERNQIVAPFDGLVADLTIKSGDMVEPTGAICELVDTRNIHIRVPFTESDAGRIAAGMEAQVTVPGRSTAIPGKVDTLEAVVQNDARGRAVYVDISVPADVNLRAGGTADAEVILDKKSRVLTIPKSALVSGAPRPAVYVVGTKNRVDLRSVTVGLVGATRVEILDGVTEGATVVADSAVKGLANGLEVDPSTE